MTPVKGSYNLQGGLDPQFERKKKRYQQRKQLKTIAYYLLFLFLWVCFHSQLKGIIHHGGEGIEAGQEVDGHIASPAPRMIPATFQMVLSS